MTHVDYLKKVGMEFKVARVRKALSSNDVAKITGLSRACLLQLENGKTDVKILTLKRVADALDVSLKDIL